MKRALWIAAAVWVVFWSLYPTFVRPRAFGRAIRAGSRELAVCDGRPGDPQQHDCYVVALDRMNRNLNAITLRSEYAGYAPVGLGVGLGVPVLAALALRRRMPA